MKSQSHYPCFYPIISYTLWLLKIAMENNHFGLVSHLFLWAIYTMAMLNNQRVINFFPNPIQAIRMKSLQLRPFTSYKYL